MLWSFTREIFFYVHVVFPQGPKENSRPKRRMNIRFVGRCLSRLRAGHNVPPLHCLWMAALYFLCFLLILWMALRQRFFLLVLPPDWRSQGEPGLPYCVDSTSSVPVTHFPNRLLLKWRLTRATYPNVCSYVNKSQVWVGHSKKWRMDDLRIGIYSGYAPQFPKT